MPSTIFFAFRHGKTKSLEPAQWANNVWSTCLIKSGKPPFFVTETVKPISRAAIYFDTNESAEQLVGLAFDSEIPINFLFKQRGPFDISRRLKMYPIVAVKRRI